MPPADPRELARAILAAHGAGIPLQEATRALARPEPLVPIREFLTSPDWCGATGFWPGVLRLAELLSQPQYRLFHVEIGKGGGKSSLVSALCAYAVYELASLPDPYAWHGLDPGKPLICMVVSTSEAQARLTVFAKVKDLLLRCPFFKDRIEPMATTIEIDGGKIMVLCGHSKSEGIEGHDVYFAVLDEANKHTNAAGVSNAKTLFETLHSSASSRFPSDYRVGTISSSRAPGDFQTRQIEEVVKRGRKLEFPV